MKMNKEKALGLIKENSETIKGFGVKKLGLFGSVAGGDAGESSDLDFIVEFEKKTFDSYMDLKFFLEELFQRKVDLVLSDAVKPRLKASILEEAVYAEGL